MEDFLGFTFNNIHSSSLGILRVTKGGLENQPFLSSQKDLTDSGVSKDETYYYGSKNESLTFSINFFYGPVGESEFQKLKTFCKTKGLGDFIFDEYQHKKYFAKLTGSAISHYYVYEGNERKYVGEGTFTFTCFAPYAQGRFVYAEDANMEVPTWQRGKILNFQHSVAMSSMLIYESDLSTIEQVLCKLPSKKANYTNLVLTGSLSYSETELGASIVGTQLDRQIIGELPSKWYYGVVSQKDGTFFKINNVGDLDMPFSFVFDRGGEIVLALDKKEKITIKKETAGEVLYDGKLRAFVDPTTKKLDTSCKVISGDFFDIPIGEHLLSIVRNGQHIWNSQIVKELEYCYRYY